MLSAPTSLDHDGSLAGYAFLAERSFGDPLRRLAVDELTARDAPAARALLAAVADLAWELRISEFTDSAYTVWPG